ncbi:Uncharacterised protein [Klebsiella pneumoniae]|nr:Uncharacterised protein [Klebsiella pneumoniae]
MSIVIPNAVKIVILENSPAPILIGNISNH